MIIKNVYLFDGNPFTHPCDIRTGDDGVISGIAQQITPEAGEEVVDGQGMIALPGMTDAHRHVWQAPFQGFAADLLLLEYLEQIDDVEFFSGYLVT